MFSRFLKRFNTELQHFYALDSDVRRIFWSYGFYLAAFPLVMTFLNAYLWRSSGNLWTIVLYNLGYVVSLPAGFYLNGLLLKKIHVLRLYFVGALLQGVTACLIVLFSVINPVNILFLGLLNGVGAGLFWGNKNYLSLFLTKHTNRVYYNSMEQVMDLLINIVVPAGAGWFIYFATQSTFPFGLSAYKIIMIVAFLLLFLSGYIVQSANIKTISIGSMIVRSPSRPWNLLRMFNVLYNVQIGLSLIVSSVMVLVLVGDEGILGTLLGTTAIISAIVLYLVGRKSSLGNIWKLVAFGSVAYLIGTGLLAGIFTWVSGIVYSIVISIAWAFQWMSSYTVTMELMDIEEKNPDKQYAYVCDNELYFNIGRLLGITIVVLFTVVASQNAALRWAPICVGIIQIPLAWFTYNLIKEIKTENRQNTILPL